MAFLNSVLGKILAGRTSALANRRASSQKKIKRLGLEQMEPRMMLCASLTGMGTADKLVNFTAAALLAGANQPAKIGLSAATAAVAPAAPSDTATAVSSSQINLAWRGVSGTTGYLVDEWISGAWKQIGSFGSTATGCSVTGLSAGTTYYFDVAAYNSVGATWGNIVNATTIAKLTPPVAPSLTATAVSASQINLAWNSVSGAASYLVDEWVNGAWKQIGSAGGGSTGFSATGLTAGTTYYFDVAASNAAGTIWSNIASAATRVAVTIDHPTAATAYSPVGGALFGSSGPSFLDVQQGAVGDCWLLASLAEVAARNPADIRNMFTAAGATVENGAVVNLYTVRFFNSAGVAKYVTVDTELPSGGGYYDHPANSVLWVALAEKAYAEANGAGFVTTQHVGSDSYAAMDGGQPAWALQAITGKSASAFAINPANITAAWNTGELVVLTSSTAPASPYIVGDATSAHAYALVNYTASSSQPFEVYNPWGTNASGWALGTFNGRAVWGLFNADAAFLTQNFAAQTFGSGAVAGGETDMHQGFKTAAELVLAGWALT